MDGASGGVHSSVGGSGGHATAGASSAAPVAPPTGNDQTASVAMLSSMLSSMASFTMGASSADDLANPNLSGEEDISDSQSAPNAAIQGDGENGAGSGGGFNGGNGGFGDEIENGGGCGGDSSSYFSTSHESTSAAAAEVMDQSLLASEVEAIAAQAEMVDGINNALTGANAQLSLSVDSANEQEKATDTAAYGAIAGAAVGIAAAGAGMAYTRGTAGTEKAEAGLKNTTDALNGVSSKTTTVENTAARNSAEKPLARQNSSESGVGDVELAPRGESKATEENPNSSANMQEEENANLNSQANQPTSAAPVDNAWTEQDKNDLMAMGYIPRDTDGSLTRGVVSSLSSSEKTELTKTVAESNQTIRNQQANFQGQQNTTRQMFEMGGNTINTFVTQGTNISAAKETKEAEIEKGEAQALSSAIQSSNSSYQIGASLLSAAAQAVGSVSSSISNLLVRNQ